MNWRRWIVYQFQLHQLYWSAHWRKQYPSVATLGNTYPNNQPRFCCQAYYLCRDWNFRSVWDCLGRIFLRSEFLIVPVLEWWPPARRAYGSERELECWKMRHHSFSHYSNTPVLHYSEINWNWKLPRWITFFWYLFIEITSYLHMIYGIARLNI